MPTAGAPLISYVLLLFQCFKVIPWLSPALFAVLDGFFGAIADAGHAMGAVFAPDRLSVFQTDVVQRAQLHALTAADAGIRCAEGIGFYKEAIEHRVHRAAHKAVVEVISWRGKFLPVSELGAKAVTLSGPDGYIYDPEGVVTEEKINYMLEMRASGRNKVQDYADKFGVQFFPGEKPFGVKADIVMPAATQNDVRMEEAKKMVANGLKYYIEVANMPTTNEALKFLMEQKNMVVAPSKAVNAGGVLVSGLEMSQNSERYSWTAEEVDSKLHQIMTGIHDGSAAAAEKYGLGYNLVAGANIVGFQKVADAMMAQGICW